MANIKLKTGVGIPPFLEIGEPAFDIQNNVFYIGDINGIPINIIDLNLSKKQFGVGKKYYNQEGVEQGEIFNDCNNIANALYSHAEGYNTSTNISTAHVEGHSNNGMIKAYHILAQSTENPFILTLDSVENIEANMQFNIFVQTEEGLSKYRGTIGSVDSENNTVTLSSTEYSNEMFAGIFENYTFDIENKSLVMNLIVDGGKVGSFSVIDTTNNFSQHIEGKSNFAGLNGHAEGYGVFATGYSSHAEGYFTTASGERSHSEGYRTIASGNESHAEGTRTKAIGYSTHSEGIDTVASGYVSHAEGGGNTTASGNYSHAEGYTSVASGLRSHSEGLKTQASGDQSHAEGESSIAEGASAHAEGRETIASGNYSHSEGVSSNASAVASHAEGSTTIASGNNAHAEGANCEATGSNSHAEGEGSKAGYRAHAEGYKTESSNCSHSEGKETKATKTGSHAEGILSQANGDASHAENNATKATGYGSHAEGNNSEASGTYSHAQGTRVKATATNAHAEGLWTVASGNEQHVQGRFNVIDTENKYAHIVGNGTANADTARKNIHTLDWEGNAWFSGKVTVGSNNEELATMTELNEISNKLSSVYTFKGSVYTTSDLPIDANTGDVYNIIRGHLKQFNVNVIEVSYQILDTEYNDEGEMIFQSHKISSCQLSVLNVTEDQFKDLYGIVTTDNKFIAFSSKQYDVTTHTVSVTISYTESFSIGHSESVDSSINSYLNHIGVSGDWYYEGTSDIYLLECICYSSIAMPGDNVAYTDGNWEKLGSGVDLSSFAQNDLSNVSNDDFKSKAIQANINSSVISVNNQIGEVMLTAADIGCYDKDEINSKLSSVYKYRGTKDYYFQLPTNAEVGDVYNIKYASGENYYTENKLYRDYTVDSSSNIPSFSDYGLEGLAVTIPMSLNDFNNLKAQGDTVIVDISVDYRFEIPIRDDCPAQATSCLCRLDDSNAFLIIVSTEEPFNQENAYFETFYLAIKSRLEFGDSPSLQFNESVDMYPSEPYLINDGDNVAWTGTEWDRLAGTEDMSLYEQTENKVTHIDENSTDDQYPTAKAVWEATKNVDGVVTSVNEKTGDVELSLSDINDFLTADINEFEYKQSDYTYFSVGYGGISAAGQGGSGYSLSITPSGLYISGNPYENNDITLDQKNWVDENDQSQGIVTTTHKLSEKADKATTLAGYGIKDSYTKDEVNTLIATGSNAVSSIILNSSTPNSTKQFKITIDDNGTLTATELEGNE